MQSKNLLQVVGFIGGAGILFGAVLGSIYAIAWNFPLSVGLTFGLPVGFVGGLVNGILIASLLRWQHSRKGELSLLMAGIVGGSTVWVMTFIGLAVFLQWLLGNLASSESFLGFLLAFSVIPAFIAVLPAVWISRIAVKMHYAKIAKQNFKNNPFVL